MADVVYVNVDDGINRVVNNIKLYVNLLNKFKNNTDMDEINTMLQKEKTEENMESARNSTHALKGLAANLSFTELYKQISELEIQIKNGEVKTEQLAIVNDVYVKTIIEVDKVIAQYA